MIWPIFALAFGRAVWSAVASAALLHASFHLPAMTARTGGIESLGLFVEEDAIQVEGGDEGGQPGTIASSR